MPNGLRRRENVAGMGANHPTLAAYRAAVEQMRNLPPDDPRNWTRQAEIHNDWCPHGNWYFLPWHRAYVLEFEEICRDLSGEPEFALPYWNWTRTRSIPDPFWQGTLLDDTRQVAQNEKIDESRFVRQRLIDRIMRGRNFELWVASSKGRTVDGRPQDNTDPKWQGGPSQPEVIVGNQSTLESRPHNYIHVWISGNMGSFMSPLDPIFWLHHCNIDRLWAEWNAPPHSHQNTSDALWTDFQLGPFNRVVGDLQDITQLGYTYDILAQPQPAQPSPLPPLLERARNRFELTEPQVASLGREVSFPVETPQSAVPLVAEAIAEEDVAEDGGPSVLAIVRDVKPPQDLRVTVNVFLNCPYLSAETPVSDPHYVGSFAFFGVHGDHGGHDTHTKSFALDLTDTVDRLRALEPDLDSRLTVQLMPVPLEGRDVQPEEIRIGGVEIVYT
jgi:tyrosinase